MPHPDLTKNSSSDLKLCISRACSGRPAHLSAMVSMSRFLVLRVPVTGSETSISILWMVHSNLKKSGGNRFLKRSSPVSVRAHKLKTQLLVQLPTVSMLLLFRGGLGWRYRYCCHELQDAWVSHGEYHVNSIAPVLKVASNGEGPG